MSKTTIDGERYISITFLKERGFLECDSRKSSNIVWSRDEKEIATISFVINTISSPYILFRYSAKVDGSEWKSMKYSFELIPHPCNFGKFRWYFQCGLNKNGVFCGKKVSYLYTCREYFGCRHCADLTYSSRNTPKSLRHGVWSGYERALRAEKYYENNVKKEHYKGKPTRQYRRYLKILGEQ